MQLLVAPCDRSMLSYGEGVFEEAQVVDFALIFTLYLFGFQGSILPTYKLIPCSFLLSFHYPYSFRAVEYHNSALANFSMDISPSCRSTNTRCESPQSIHTSSAVPGLTTAIEILIWDIPA